MLEIIANNFGPYTQSQGGGAELGPSPLSIFFIW